MAFRDREPEDTATYRNADDDCVENPPHSRHSVVPAG